MFCYGNPISFIDVNGFEATESGTQGTVTNTGPDGQVAFTPSGIGGAPTATVTWGDPGESKGTKGKGGGPGSGGDGEGGDSEGTVAGDNSKGSDKGKGGEPSGPGSRTSMFGPGHNDTAPSYNPYQKNPGKPVYSSSINPVNDKFNNFHENWSLVVNRKGLMPRSVAGGALIYGKSYTALVYSNEDKETMKFTIESTQKGAWVNIGVSSADNFNLGNINSLADVFNQNSRGLGFALMIAGYENNMFQNDLLTSGGWASPFGISLGVYCHDTSISKVTYTNKYGNVQVYLRNGHIKER